MDNIAEFPDHDSVLPRNAISRQEWESFVSDDIDAAAELDAVVAALQMARLDPMLPEDAAGVLVALHGALLLFQMGGRADLLPAISGFAFGRRTLERQVVSKARRLAQHANHPYGAWLLAADQIEELIAVVIPELRVSVA